MIHGLHVDRSGESTPEKCTLLLKLSFTKLLKIRTHAFVTTIQSKVQPQIRHSSCLMKSMSNVMPVRRYLSKHTFSLHRPQVDVEERLEMPA